MRGKRMTIFLGEADQWHHRPLYLAILEHLKTAGCAGATVTRGVAGFGAHSVIKTANILRLSTDLPVIITAIDSADKIDGVLPEIASMLSGGLVIVDDTEVYYHSAAFSGGLPDVHVSDVMTADPETVSAATPVAEVIERLRVREYTALPVIDDQRRVVGVISDTDMLNAGLSGLSVSLHKVVDPDLLRDHLARLKDEGNTVGQVMTAPAVTVLPSASLRVAARLMHERELKRLPVVDAAGHLVGVIGRLDILRSIVSAHAQRTAPSSHRLPQEGRTVAEVMDAEVLTVPDSAPLADVVGKLLASNAKRLLVIDAQGHLAGVITDTDIIGRVDPEQRPGLITQLRSRWNEAAQRQVQRAYGQHAADVMTSPVVAVHDTDTVIDALTLAVQRRLKRLPVIGAGGQLVGTVSRPALLAASLELTTGTTRK